MKQLTEYNRVSGYLNKIFSMLNETYFENALSKPVITIQSTPKAYGHVTVGKVWDSDGELRHELNIGAGTLTRPIENIVATMLHEMVHLYNLQRGVQDTSRGGTYHNTKFRDEATKRDLIIEHHPTYGWTITSPSDNLIMWCLERDLIEIQVNRNEGYALPPSTGGKTGTATAKPTTGTAKKPSSTRKYICPCCGASVRATREIRLICGECYDGSDPATLHYLTQA